MDAELVVGFICLVSHDRTRVILPLAAACHARMLQGLLQAVHLSCVGNTLRAPRLFPPPSRGGSAAEEAEENEEAGGEFVSFAAAYPYLGERGSPFLNVPLHCLDIDTLVRIADFLLRKSCEGYALAKRQRQTLEYQQSREGCRNAFEAGRALEAFQEELWPPVDRGGEVAVLKDLDRTSQVDQLKAIQLLLGSDFLGC